MKQHQILNRHFTLGAQLNFCLDVKTDAKLKVQGIYYLPLSKGGELPRYWQDRSRWRYLGAADLKKVEVAADLGMPYTAASQACTALDTVVPDSMGFEMHAALERLRGEVGNVDDYVCDKLGYTHMELCRSLAAEQVDAVALAIYNIEQRGQGIIVGDQTGIGKGRVAAAVIRYACRLGKQPFFITEKPNLFSDIYRDLAAIGSDSLVPFIVNSRDSKTAVKDEQGNTLYEAPPAHEQGRIFDDQSLPKNYDLALATYSQFASSKPTKKQAFLANLAQGNILILDESHNAGGNVEASATADFFYKTVQQAAGVVFLSATFAKRPDNMPLYAVKTCVSEANLSNSKLIAAIEGGGVALQEIIAANLVDEGQMIRRERSFDGIEVSYITLDSSGEKDFGVENKEAEHWAIADSITDILRDIISFQSEHVLTVVKKMDEVFAAENKEIKERGGTGKLGVDAQPFFSKLFRVVDQMLFALKSKSVAELAIRYLKEGKKPVIAFSSTMGAFIEQMEDDRGNPVGEGSVVSTDFSEVLMRGLEGVLRYSEVDAAGNFSKKTFAVSELSPEAQAEYYRIREKIKSTTTGIHISPIDVVKQTIEEAGFSVSEVTGRKVELRTQGKDKAVIYNRKKENVNDAFRRFNNNRVDCLMINQSGSTGASAHAIVTDKVKEEEVKQRVMLMLQAELDINREVQKRGRVNRTGQLYKPKYVYVTSPVPAERRLMMMLQSKLKSLDANTTSNQKNSKALLQADDFLNKYGDKVVFSYLQENLELNEKLGDPCGIADKEKDSSAEDAARKTTGRVAVLSCAEQQSFYNEIIERYKSYVEYLQQVGEYDLEVETMNLEAETMESTVVVVGKGGVSRFGGDTHLEKCMCNVLKKPFTKVELQNLLSKGIGGQAIIPEYETFLQAKEGQLLRDNTEKYERLKAEIYSEAKYQNAKTEAAKKQYYEGREKELDGAAVESQSLINTRLSNEKNFLMGYLRFFSVGKVLNFPVGDVSQRSSKAVFVGFKIDKKRPNPYAPSAVKLCFALADSNKYFELVLSGEQGAKVQQVMGASHYISASDLKLVEQWETATREAAAPRRLRYLVTGNILQGFSEYKGKLISYTTADGQAKKGILMPESWEAKASSKIKLPIKYAQKVIAGLTYGSLQTENGLSFMRYGDGYRVATAALSMQRYGSLIKDERIIKLIGSRDGFQKMGSSWVGVFPEKVLPDLLNILQELGDSALLSSAQYEEVKATLPKEKPKEKAKVTPVSTRQESSDRNKRLRLAKVKAIAVKKKLELLQMVAGFK